MTDTWQLAQVVSLRPEAYGGMAFQRERGVTLEVDPEAYRFLCSYLLARPLPPPSHPAALLVPQLVHLGFLCPEEVGPDRAQLPPEATRLGEGYVLSAPVVIHLAITTRCNLACSGCYVPHPDSRPEWTVAELCATIDQWARMRVFQLAVGGGEPLLYEGLFRVLTHAREQGIVPNLTTNGTLIDTEVIHRLERSGVARVNVSWNQPDGKPGRGDQTVTRALRLLRESTLQVGVNLLVTPELLPRLPQVLAGLHDLGIRQVTVLRPKPPAIATEAGASWYEANRLRRADLLLLRDV